ncbi:hypothetical protein [Rossellomorea aquimaris]|uniref:hypothetical protein n=1 Tax=Rossellomorea aquimaris TaxID=189382 RepID=UPI001CFE4FA1|nr:hypothetical protein [Rossellomorea aquimaris]
MDLFFFISVIVGMTFIFLYFVIRYDLKKKNVELEQSKVELEKMKLQLNKERQKQEEEES